MGTCNLCCNHTINYFYEQNLNPIGPQLTMFSAAPINTEVQFTESNIKNESNIPSQATLHESFSDFSQQIIETEVASENRENDQIFQQQSFTKNKNQFFEEQNTDRESLVSHERNLSQSTTLSSEPETGFVTKMYEDGSKYVGWMRKGLKHGTGTYTSENGIVHEGIFDKDKQTNYGTETWTCGSSYHGEYENGYKNGKGVFQWSNGTSYAGYFKNDEQHGMGTYNFPDGRIYVGLWHNGRKHGKGTMKWPDGRKYHGEFVSDIISGYGVYKMKNGAIFEGYFQNGKKHGRGRYVNSRGYLQEGEWRRGKRLNNVLSYK